MIFKRKPKPTDEYPVLNHAEMPDVATKALPGNKTKSDSNDEMSTLVPQFVRRWFRHSIWPRIPLKWRDRFIHFYVQTRIIFTRSFLMILIGLFLLFAGRVFSGSPLSSKPEAVDIIMLAGVLLTIITTMNLWEAERELGAYELLIMRIPSIKGMLWYKLRVAIFWTVVLAIPLIAAFSWFVSIPLKQQLFVYLPFFIMSVMFVGLVTMLMGTFLKGSITAAIGSLIICVPIFSFSGSGIWRWVMPIPSSGFFMMDGFYSLGIPMILVNRVIFFVFVWIILKWLQRRLNKTERWLLSG